MATFNGLQTPDSMTVGLNISYTVPAGKIAKVSATISATNIALYTATTLNSNITPISSSVSSQSQTIDIILKAGDILSSTRTTGSVSATVNSNIFFNRSSSASTVLLVNGVSSHVVRAPAGLSGDAPGTSGTLTIAVTGTADLGFIAEEYYG